MNLSKVSFSNGKLEDQIIFFRLDQNTWIEVMFTNLIRVRGSFVVNLRMHGTEVVKSQYLRLTSNISFFSNQKLFYATGEK